MYCYAGGYIRGVIPGSIEGLKMAFDGKLQMFYSGSPALMKSIYEDHSSMWNKRILGDNFRPH